MASKVEDPWIPLKDLAAIVEAAVLKGQPGILTDLEVVLKKHKPTFIGLLKNPPRSSADAALVRKAATEGLVLNDPEAKQKLPAAMVEEALIISEMFEMNEISAVQLLLQAEEQLCQYPGLSRGLVAVLLYYDGRKAVVHALRTLIQGRSGVSWTLGASDNVTEYITKYTESLLEDGLVDKILTFLKTNEWNKEVMLLQKNLALGNAKHRRQVYDLFSDIRQGVADCLFAYAGQSGLPRQDVIRLMDHMSKVKTTEGTSCGTLDDVNVTLTMALMYSLDAGALNKNSEEAFQALPMMSDLTFIPTMHRKIANVSQKWNHIGIQSTIQLTWSMTLATLRSLNNLEDDQQIVVEDDETILDHALDSGVFHWLLQTLINSRMLKSEEFYVRRIHQLLTDLIVLMPLKVKELRNRADEAARNKLMHEQEGVQFTVPLQGQHFESLLTALSALYSNDSYGLILEFWCPSDNVERYSQRQVSLYKFIRLAGDLLMPSLYAPYVQLLVNLSGHPDAALHCFNLLKLNGGQGDRGGSTVSWDHFFASLHQYFSNLRTEASTQMPMNLDSIYRRPLTRGISPTEVQGLASVLKLITAVSKHSEAARIAIAEHSQWQPSLVFVGLLSCAVPTGLKAEILNSLTALGMSSEVAYNIWQNIEAAQLINTIPSTSQQRPLGLFSEIEDIEARNEEYPLTRAFLRLLDGLTEHGLPEGLGQGQRLPGFRPYFNFLRDHIFHKFSTRAYKNASERWNIGTLCLKIMVKLLQDYQPTVQDFSSSTSSSLGFHLMTHLLQSSETLRLLLFLMDEAVGLIESYQDFNGKEKAEECALQILKLLDLGLKLQVPMLECSRMAPSTNLILTSLSNLLLAVNPRSGKPDHLLNVVKFVMHAWRMPAHGLHAIEVIRGVGKTSAMAQTAILSTFRVDESTANCIIKAFADVLDNTEEEYLDDNPEVKIDDIRIATINLLLDGLEMPGTTLTHFLLGFNLQKGIAKSTIQPQGVLGAVRSPFHAILALLRPIQGSVELPPAFAKMPNLVVASMKLIYTLCANIMTSEVTLRFLRSSEDFLCRQVGLLPWTPMPPGSSVCGHRATAWLMKTVAIEAKVLCQTRQRSQLVKLSGLFLESMTSTCNPSESFMSQLSRALPMMQTVKKKSEQHRLLSILESIDFTEESVGMPAFEVFDVGQVEQVLNQCRIKNLVDVKSLHKILHQELSNLQNASNNGLGSQRSLIQDEIRLILKYAVDWNAMQDKMIAKKNLLDAWRQVAEMLLCSIPNDQIQAQQKQRLLLELIQFLLNKVLADGAMLEMTNQVSGVVLLLMTSLRQTYNAKTDSSTHPDAYVTMLDETPKDGSKMYSAALQAILKGLVMWIVGTSAAAQRVRANLYGALLNYLRIGKVTITKRNSDEERLKKANLEVLLGYGDAFLDIVCRDSVSGHEIRMMLALSVLDELLCLENRGSWLYYLTRQGYLRHIIESLANEDGLLNNLVSTKPVDHLKTFYVYETKMALLTRLASTATGSEMLLESGLMVKLAEMSVFSARPEASAASMTFEPMDETLIPSALSRYQQVIFPVLKLCQAVMASLGSENRSASTQILHFLTSHECIIRVGLHYSNLFSLAGLQELSLLTGVISRSVTFEVANLEIEAELASNLSRIQRQMISLMANFGHQDCLIKKITNGNLFSTDHRIKAVKYVLEIQSNCLAYTASITGKAKQCRVVLAPSLSEAESSGHRSMSLGHLVLLLQHMLSYLNSSRRQLRDLQDKMSSLNHLSTNELSALNDQGPSMLVSSLDQKSLVAEQIQRQILEKSHEVELSIDTIENSMFVLWRHLDYFFHSTSATHRQNLDPIVKSRRSDPGFPGFQSTTEDTIDRLKQETRSCFNDALFRNLDGVESALEEDRYGVFFATFNRRLKRIATLFT